MRPSSDAPQKTAAHRWSFNAGDSNSPRDLAVVVNELPIADGLGRTLSAEAMDLVELVAAVHLADRSARRPGYSKAGDSWSRRMHLVIGVRDPSRWCDASIYDELIWLLRWLTDDEWLIDFVPRVAPARSAETVQFLFEAPPGGDLVSLFSGGLDSLAGLATDIASGLTPLAVSIESNSRLASSQRVVLASLNDALGCSIRRVPVVLHLTSGRALESSQRARGFGFLALGSVVASVSSLETLRVYENGVGAINLPYTAAQTGAHGTRPMHPETLRRSALLFARVLDHPLSIENPSQLLTKAEMCRSISEVLHPAISVTESCDTAFSHRRPVQHSCGCCTSCLLRRQALAAAGLDRLDPPSAYRIDAFDSSEPDGVELYDLRAMLSQAARIEHALASASEGWLRLVREFPDLILSAEAMSSSLHAAADNALADMLRRYVGEWTAVPSALVDRYLNSCRPAA